MSVAPRLNPCTPGRLGGHSLSQVSSVLEEVVNEGREGEGHLFVLSSLCDVLATSILSLLHQQFS